MDIHACIYCHIILYLPDSAVKASPCLVPVTSESEPNLNPVRALPIYVLLVLGFPVLLRSFGRQHGSGIAVFWLKSFLQQSGTLPWNSGFVRWHWHGCVW